MKRVSKSCIIERSGVHHVIYRKSQAEIMGIAIVMVLIMVGILFVIQFIVVPDSNNIKKTYSQKELSSNFLNAILKTTTSCNNMRMTELIQDCAENHDNPFQENCIDPTHLICDNPRGCKSCDFLNKSLYYITDNTLKNMALKYELYLCKYDPIAAKCGNRPGDLLINISDNGCVLGKDDAISANIISQQIPVQTNVGNRILVMNVC
jgi:hypothetical protein